MKRKEKKKRLKKKTVKKIQCTVKENGWVHLMYINPIHL
jgi:hypothetical protein